MCVRVSHYREEVNALDEWFEVTIVHDGQTEMGHNDTTNISRYS